MKYGCGPLGYTVGRRDAASGFIQMTSGEVNRALYPTSDTDISGAAILNERMHQSEVPCRPSRTNIVFFLSPWGWMWSDDFLMGHESVPRVSNTPQGRLSQMDDRRNIAIPPRISYGALVGEADGVAPYGLD